MRYLAAALALGFSLAASAAVQTDPNQSVRSLDRIVAKSGAATSKPVVQTDHMIATPTICVGNCPVGNRPRRQ